ncbi:MAG TPA: hypothetical protein VMT53_06150 [Terriglobales bacterium]|nr:hypothetical protein [Terriglobales bacterium]
MDPGTLYTFAHTFYWDFRRLSEGRTRQRLDRAKHEQLIEQMRNLDIPGAARARFEEEMQAGVSTEFERETRTKYLEKRLSDTIPLAPYITQEEAMRQIRIPGEYEVVQELLNPKITPDRIREICKESVMVRAVQFGSETKVVEVPAWPISVGSMFPVYLAEYAEQYVAALNDPRFPRSDTRPSTRLKQFWFLSRALAGALYGVATRTAINLVGSLRPEQMFYETRLGKPARKPRKVKRHILRH